MLPSIIFDNLTGANEDDENFIKEQYEFFEENLAKEFQSELDTALQKYGNEDVSISGKYDVCKYMAYYSAWYDKKEKALENARNAATKSTKKSNKKTTESKETTTESTTETSTEATTETKAATQTTVGNNQIQQNVKVTGQSAPGGGSGTQAFSTPNKPKQPVKQHSSTVTNPSSNFQKKKKSKDEEKATDKTSMKQFLVLVKEAKIVKVVKKSVKKSSRYIISYRGDHAFAKYLDLTKDEIEVCDQQAELLKAFLGDDYNGEVSLEDMAAGGELDGYGEEAKDVKKITQMSDKQVWKLLTGLNVASKPSTSQCSKSRMDRRMTNITVKVWDWKSPGTKSLKKVTKKKTITVNKALKNFWISFFNAVYMDESKIVIHELYGYSYRLNTSKTSISAHSFGCTMDINWSSSINGYGNGYNDKVASKSTWEKMKNTQTKYEIIYNGSPLQKIVYKYTLSWGGEWKSVKDPMHVSFIGDIPRSSLKSRGKRVTYYMPGNGGGTGKKYHLSKSDYEFVCKVVAQECSVNYEGSLAVISFMCNQNEVGAANLKGKGLVGVCKSGWYQAYNDGSYRRRKPQKFVKRAVTDALNGKRNIPICVLEFWTVNYKSHDWGKSAGYEFYATIGDNDYYYSRALRKKYNKQYFKYKKK